MLDSAVEDKKQRERITNDDTYFISNDPPDNVPAWAIDFYETDEDELVDDDENDDVGGLVEELEFEDVGLIDDSEFYEADDYFKSDFMLNSAEMNEVRPEDLDEVGESSTSNQVSRIIFLLLFLFKTNKPSYYISNNNDRNKNDLLIKKENENLTNLSKTKIICFDRMKTIISR